MGGEGTIYLNLVMLKVLPAQLLCTREASSWYCFALVGGAHLRIFYYKR